MAALPGSLMFCLIWAYVGYCRGIQLSMDRTADGVICGRLHCWAHQSFTDPSIYSVYGLTVYDVTQANERVKLASVSVFEPFFYVDSTKLQDINATGRISWNSAELKLALYTNSYCISRSFMCELDFANLDSRPELIRETVSPGSGGNCLVADQIAQTAVQVDARLEELETIGKENADLKEQLDKLQVNCTKGNSQSLARGKFLLWGNVVALCDLDTDNGGWVIIQRRSKGNVDFYRGWNDYKNGFGTPDADFWIGNDIIHNLTSQGYTELRIDMEYQGKQYFAHYSSFIVANETLNYRLSLTGYAGNATDSMGYNNGYVFSTIDRDHTANYNCVVNYHGAWWYGGCTNVNLNGLWGAQNITSSHWYGISNRYSVTFSEMKLRRV